MSWLTIAYCLKDIAILNPKGGTLGWLVRY